MFLKKFKKVFILSILTLFSIPNSIFAYSDYILVGGQNIGIELQAKGIMIVGLYKVNDNYPARDSGLEVGDMIISINDSPVASVEDMVEKIDKCENKDSIKIK
jgi:stage IV sporulation protein B